MIEYNNSIVTCLVSLKTIKECEKYCDFIDMFQPSGVLVGKRRIMDIYDIIAVFENYQPEPYILKLYNCDRDSAFRIIDYLKRSDFAS